MKSLLALPLLAIAAPLYAEEIPTYTADEIVVTATRFLSQSQTSPFGIQVITREDIARSTATTIPELLSHFAGVKTRSNSGSPDAQIDMRGFGITGGQNTLVLLDGQRLSEIELVSPKWSAIPMDSIERIEILRSSGAVLYGGGATGGTINIITKMPKPDQREGFVSAGYGTYNTSELRAGGLIGSDNLSLALHANRYDSDNYRKNNEIAQENIEGDFRFTTENTQWALKFGADDQSLRLPGARTESQLQSDRRGTATPNDWSTRTGGHLNLNGSTRIGDAELTADLSYRERNAKASYAPGYSIETKVNVAAFNPRLKLGHTLLGQRNDLVLGLDLDDWDYNSKNTYSTSLASQKNQAFYFQNQTMLSTATRITLGGRLHQVESSVGTISQTKSPRAFELGLRHELSQGLALFAKLDQSFRIATVDENQFQISLLEPQTSHDREIGFEKRLAAGALRASLYQIRLNNEIAYLPSTLVPPFGANINLPPTQRQGLELAANWRATDTLDVFANYTYAEATFREGTYNGTDVTGKNVPLVPRHAMNLGASWRIAPTTNLGADAQYIGEQYFDNDQANTFGRKMSSYTVVNARLAHDVGPWRLAATVKNLFNEKYFSYAIKSGTTFSAYPAPDRTLFMSAEYRFK
ncbi:TonB-dependent receptor [Sulfuricella sp. T08]|uniref:TonB-dependent receptor n=1 Tax=Sulfuricella sp. T08 TaxID=1632857 RepID=UPI0006179FF3|nr:TonB-dependent receptor [Sulfuricella sp. T08]GAO34767.1 TonB-dependent receptor [Sulfuricella sp. T08]